MTSNMKELQLTLWENALVINKKKKKKKKKCAKYVQDEKGMTMLNVAKSKLNLLHEI